MRRVPAALLLLVFSLPLSLPLLAPLLAPAPDDSALPACCRRNGQHHCAMAGMSVGNIPSTTVVVSETCPYSPFTHAPLMLPPIFFGTAVATAVHPTALAEPVREAEAGYRISADRARHKRGPPPALAS